MWRLFLQWGASSYEFSGSKQMDLAGGQFLLVLPQTMHRGGQEIRMPSELCGIVLEPFSRKTMSSSPFTTGGHRYRV